MDAWGRKRETDRRTETECVFPEVGRTLGPAVDTRSSCTVSSCETQTETVPQWTLDRRAVFSWRLRQGQSRSGHSIVVHSLLLRDSDRDNPAVDTRSSCTDSSCETQTETVPQWTLDRRAQSPLARLRQRQSRSGHSIVVHSLLLRDSDRDSPAVDTRSSCTVSSCETATRGGGSGGTGSGINGALK